MQFILKQFPLHNAGGGLKILILKELLDIYL